MHNCCPPGFCNQPRLDPDSRCLPFPTLACAVYQMPRSRTKLIFLTCRGGMVYFRGILIGTMHRMRNFPPGKRRPTDQIFPSTRSNRTRIGALLPRKGIEKRWKWKGREKRKVSSPPDDNRSLDVEDERVRGSPEHVTIIPSGVDIYVHVQDPNGWCARQSGTRDRLTQRSPSIVTRRDNASYISLGFGRDSCCYAK